MKLLLLTKRHFMAKDIVAEAYGRQYELASQLAASGWGVKSFCLNYRSIYGTEVVYKGGVQWHSYAAPLGSRRWVTDVNREVASWKPDVILAGSDPLHIVAGSNVSRKARVPLVVDLHDNLESFRLMDVPGLRGRFLESVQNAAVVLCVSGRLRDLVMEKYEPRGQVLVLENAIPVGFGKERGSREASRRNFGFQETDRVIGVAGALYRKRGIETILSGFDMLRAEDPALILALAGPTDKTRRRFGRTGIRYFGKLDYSAMPSFLGVLDVGIVPNIRPVFAEYCHPQKAVELCALSVPLVGASLGVMKDLARGHEEILYQPADAADLARAVSYQLEHRVVLDTNMHTWAEQTDRLEQALVDLPRWKER